MSTEQMMKELATDVPFPWSIGEGRQSHQILDANGDPVAQFYGPSNERHQAMMATIFAVNTLAGITA